MKQVHGYAAIVHGFLLFGHALGCVYALRRKNLWDGVVHLSAGAFSLRAARHHAREAK